MRIARHFGMDWLRIGAFALLILYHIGMVFVPWNYHVKTAHPIDAVAIPMLALNPWRLSLLFVVSGFASRALFAKLVSPAWFLGERSTRLIVPLLFGMIVIVPPQPWAELMAKQGYTYDFIHFWLSDYFRFAKLDGVDLPTWNHLWFLVYLWAYTLVLAIALVALPARVQASIARVSDVVLGDWRVLIVPIALLLANAALTWPYHTETHDFFGDLPVHRVYLAMFLFGFLLAGGRLIWEGIRHYWWPAAGIALASYAVAVAVELGWPGKALPRASIITLIVIARAVQAWSTIVALIGMADRWLNVDHPWRATLAEAVFPFYIIHQTIIVVVGWYILRFALHPATEFAILLAATVAGCLVFYFAGREIGLLRPLIGLKRRRSG